MTVIRSDMAKMLLFTMFVLFSRVGGVPADEEIAVLKLQMTNILSEVNSLKSELELVKNDLAETKYENKILKAGLDQLLKENEEYSLYENTKVEKSGYVKYNSERPTKESQHQNDSNEKKLRESVYDYGKDKRLLEGIVTTPSPDISNVAFSVGLSKVLQLGSQQTIEYDTVFTNVGNAYDIRHGHFIAPLKGVYLFSFTLLHELGDQVYLEMVRNGFQIAIVYGYPQDRSLASQTIVTVLEKGDMVWVRHAHGGTPSIDGYKNEPYNTFSGTFLFKL